MKDQFKYFVAYKWYASEKEGFGNAIILTKRKMDSDLICEIETNLNNQQKVENSIIINWQKVFEPVKNSESTKELIAFACYLTGHDEATIIQMYNDWIRVKKL